MRKLSPALRRTLWLLGALYVLDHLVASNKRVDLFAYRRIRDGKPKGDLYARWGILGLGVALADGQRDFHLLHAQRWYKAPPDLIQTAK